MSTRSCTVAAFVALFALAAPTAHAESVGASLRGYEPPYVSAVRRRVVRAARHAGGVVRVRFALAREGVEARVRAMPARIDRGLLAALERAPSVSLTRGAIERVRLRPIRARARAARNGPGVAMEIDALVAEWERAQRPTQSGAFRRAVFELADAAQRAHLFTARRLAAVGKLDWAEEHLVYSRAFAVSADRAEFASPRHLALARIADFQRRPVRTELTRLDLEVHLEIGGRARRDEVVGGGRK